MPGFSVRGLFSHPLDSNVHTILVTVLRTQRETGLTKCIVSSLFACAYISRKLQDGRRARTHYRRVAILT